MEREKSSIIPKLFSEESGLIIEVNNENLEKVKKYLGGLDINFEEIAKKNSEKTITINSFRENLIELKGFTSKEIIRIFQKTKLYIDFGYHPGKDKMPREAVLFNNCVITNLKGSAYNKFDIPINKQFK